MIGYHVQRNTTKGWCFILNLLDVDSSQNLQLLMVSAHGFGATY
jgi:hypothetical protein